MKIISWNINGLRAILKKGFLAFITREKPDLLCLQETKTNQPLPLLLPEYEEFWQCGTRAGYSGTLTLVKKGAAAKFTRFELPSGTKFQLLHQEGRVVALEHEQLVFFNVYFPNGGQGEARLEYKREFYAQFLALTKELLAQGRQVLVCGDVNTAHKAIDLARPKANEKNTGFLPWERAWVSEYLATGMIDVWRTLHPQKIAYTWWAYRTAARSRDVGWRIDYFLASKNLQTKIKKCEILGEVEGSDHAPIELEIEI